MNEREAFIAAIREDPTEPVNRYAYADWLQEHGYDDESEFIRSWTPEKQQAAQNWFERFINVYADKWDIHDDDRPSHKITVNELLDAARAYLSDESKTCFWTGGGFGFRDAMTDEYERTNFWEYYSIYDAVLIAEEVKETGEPFSCCRSY